MFTANPFPGPRPYTAEERERFFGRDDTALDLADEVLSHRVLTVFGPSGAGKSSLLQAAVIPRVVEKWDLRAVVVDAWPPEQVLAVGPTGRLVDALEEQLGLGEVPGADLAGAIRLAFRRSDRPLLLVLDQLEQLLVHHELPVLESFVAALAEIEAQKGVALHVVLALREDYLGRWTDLLSRNDRLKRHLFRVTRLRVEEITRAVVMAAASGEPAQRWDEGTLRPLIEEMGIPGQWRADAAEVESAYVQIVCRALWEAGGPSATARLSPRDLLHHYLADTLASLGRLEQPARELMESKLITRTGSRAPVSLEGAREVVPNAEDALRILETLEQARILRAWEHHGDRFFELGHDWLARPIQESAAQKREAAAARQRWRRRVAIGAVGVALVAVIFALSWLFVQAKLQQREAELARAETTRALEQSEKDRTEAQAQRQEALNQKGIAESEKERTQEALGLAETRQKEAEAQRAKAEAATRAALASEREAILSQGEAVRQTQRARDTLAMLAVKELSPDMARVIPFLLEVKDVENARGWRDAAWGALQHPASVASLSREEGRTWSVSQFVPGGTAVALGGTHGEVALWSFKRDGAPAMLGNHDEAVRILVFSPDGRWLASASDDATVKIWDMQKRTLAVSLPHGATPTDVVFSPDGDLLVTVSAGGTARLWKVGEWRAPLFTAESRKNNGLPTNIWGAGFNGTGDQWLTAGSDGEVMVFNREGKVITTSKSAGGHCALASLRGASFHPSLPEVLIYGSHQAAIRWDLAVNKCVEIRQPDELKKASYSPYGGSVLTISDDGVVRLWSRITIEETPLLEVKKTGGYADAMFDPTGRWIALSDMERAAELLELDEHSNVIRRVTLGGQQGNIVSLSLSKDGASLATIDEYGDGRVWRIENPTLSVPLADPGGPAIVDIQLTQENTIKTRTSEGIERTIPIPEAARSRAEISEWGFAPTTGPQGLLFFSPPPYTSSVGITLGESIADMTAWIPDPRGRFLITASEDGQVRLWPLYSDEEVKAKLAESGHRCIPIEDRMQYLGETTEEAQAAYATCTP